MAKSTKKTPQRLKVYQAVFGFHESVVAAPNQTAALKAWGTRQNLFAEGTAKVTADQDVMAAAITHPLTPLRRAIGSTDAFSLDPSAPSLDVAKFAAVKASAGKPLEPPKPARPPPDRSALMAAETALTRLEQARERQEQAFRRRRDALDAEAAAARTQWAQDRATARKTLQREREAYRKAVDRT